MKSRCLWILCLGVLVMGMIWLNGCECCQPEPSKPPEPPSSLECIDFEDPSLNSKYNILDVIYDSGAKVFVGSFQWGNGQWTSGGYAQIMKEEDQDAGGSGQYVWTNNVNLSIDFCRPIKGLTLHFGYYGGNNNIKINGELVNFNPFDDIHGKTIGGVKVTVIDGFGKDVKGTLKLCGTIKSFVIGGQELAIDDVCPDVCPE